MCRGLGNNIQTGNLPSVKEIICIMFWKEKSDPGTKSWEEKKNTTFYVFFQFLERILLEISYYFFSPSKKTPEEKQKQ